MEESRAGQCRSSSRPQGRLHGPLPPGFSVLVLAHISGHDLWSLPAHWNLHPQTWCWPEGKTDSEQNSKPVILRIKNPEFEAQGVSEVPLELRAVGFVSISLCTGFTKVQHSQRKPGQCCSVAENRPTNQEVKVPSPVRSVQEASDH